MEPTTHITIRPPSEADSILLQVTQGCSHNRCTFCGVYKNVTFTIRDPGALREELAYAALHFRNRHRVFLCDGDALIVPHEQLVKLLQDIRKALPWISRVGTYANAKSIAAKSDTQLKELRDLGLRIIHMGLESGDDATLQAVGKWGMSDDIVREGLRARVAGINLFVTVLLGLAGQARSHEHAVATGQALSRMNPEYVGALSLILIEGTPLYERAQNGLFRELQPLELLRELRTMMEYTSLNPGYFYANHASNHLPLRARLPRDKEQALSLIDEAIAGAVPLRPEWMRGL